MNVPANNKFFYFGKGSGADQNNECALYPVSAFRGAEAAGAAADEKIDLFFTPQRITTVATGADNDTIRILFRDGVSSTTVLEALANEIAFGSDSIIKVDSDNGVFFSSNVTAVAIAQAGY